MKLIRCNKCGAVVMGEDAFLQKILDAMERANWRAAHGATKAIRGAAMAEASQYKAMYKAYMHNLTNKQYSESVTPMILQEVRQYVMKRGLLTQQEWDALNIRAKARAKQQIAFADREADRIFGEFDNVCANKANRDPTADAAIKNCDRKRR